MQSTQRERDLIKTLVSEGYTMAEIGRRIQRPTTWVWDRLYDMRRRGEAPWPAERSISLPSISILSSGVFTTDDDFRAGESAAREAGLS